MIPVMIDPALTSIMLVGRGDLAARRLAWLRDGGADPLVFSDAPEAEFASLAGDGLQLRLPDAAEIAAAHLIWVADLPPAAAANLASAARSAGTLINVEDVLPQCDFHTPALLRRGRLVLAAGTGGASPALSQRVRKLLDAAFPPAWGEALDEIAEARLALRAAGASMTELAADANRRLDARGL